MGAADPAPKLWRRLSTTRPVRPSPSLAEPAKAFSSTGGAATLNIGSSKLTPAAGPAAAPERGLVKAYVPAAGDAHPQAPLHRSTSINSPTTSPRGHSCDLKQLQPRRPPPPPPQLADTAATGLLGGCGSSSSSNLAAAAALVRPWQQQEQQVAPFRFARFA